MHSVFCCMCCAQCTLFITFSLQTFCQIMSTSLLYIFTVFNVNEIKWKLTAYEISEILFLFQLYNDQSATINCAYQKSEKFELLFSTCMYAVWITLSISYFCIQLPLPIRIRDDMCILHRYRIKSKRAARIGLEFSVLDFM